MRLPVLVGLLAMAWVSPALAQSAPPKIWSIPFGTAIASLGPDFVDPACGTNGGPAGLKLASFARYSNCPVEEGGLREVWFRYEDVSEYIMRAYRNAHGAAVNSYNSVLGHPAILSFLVDGDGAVRGYRIFTDPKAAASVRYEAHVIGTMLQPIIGRGWNCVDLPRGEAENDIEGIYVKSRCNFDDARKTATVETRFFLRSGQTVVDPATGLPRSNQFESSTRLEVREVAPHAAAGSAPVAQAPVTGDPKSAEYRFLSGLTNDCPNCSLAAADLTRRDLTGADLSGADLDGASLHRAILRNADLSGAKLSKANLNLVEVTGARFDGAIIENSVLYAARGSNVSFVGARLSKVRMGDVDLRSADFSAATMLESDLGGSRLNGAKFVGATLSRSYLYQARLLRTDFTGATALGANLVDAVLDNALLAKSNFAGTDFMGASLRLVDLTDANMTDVRLTRATLVGADKEGADFTGAQLR